MSAVSELLNRRTTRTTQTSPSSKSAVAVLLDRAEPSVQAHRRASILGAAGRGAAESVAPSLAGLAAGGATTAATAPFLGPFAVIPGIGAGLATGMGASRAQDVLLQKLLPEQRRAFLEQRGRDVKERPIAALIGEFLPSLLALKPGLPKTMSGLRTAAISGAVQGGVETASELAQGEGLSPGRIATSTALGATLTKPTRVGRRFFPETPRTSTETIPPESGDPTVPISPEPPSPSLTQRVADAVKAARPIRAKQESLYHQRR